MVGRFKSDGGILVHQLQHGVCSFDLFPDTSQHGVPVTTVSGADEPDLALDIDGIRTGQLSSTVCNVIAQMITAEIYNCFVSKGKEAPVLLSANIKGADVHNNSLTDPYGRRVR